MLRFGLCSRSRFLVSSQKQQNDCEERKQNLIFCRPSRSVKSRNHTIELDSLCLCFSAYMIFFFCLPDIQAFEQVKKVQHPGTV